VDQTKDTKEEQKTEPVKITAAATSKGAWGEDEIIAVEEPQKPAEEQKQAETAAPGAFVTPTQGTEFALTKIKGSLISGLHCAIGEYETALRLLQKQIALINPVPLKPVMQHVHLYSKPRFALLANAVATDMQLVDSNGKPVIPIKISLLNSVHKVFWNMYMKIAWNEFND